MVDDREFRRWRGQADGIAVESVERGIWLVGAASAILEGRSPSAGGPTP